MSIMYLLFILNLVYKKLGLGVNKAVPLRCEMVQLAACRAHNPKVAGSSPALATTIKSR